MAGRPVSSAKTVAAAAGLSIKCYNHMLPNNLYVSYYIPISNWTY